jgi:hypothetical protein
MTGTGGGAVCPYESAKNFGLLFENSFNSRDKETPI